MPLKPIGDDAERRRQGNHAASLDSRMDSFPGSSSLSVCIPPLCCRSSFARRAFTSESPKTEIITSTAASKPSRFKSQHCSHRTQRSQACQARLGTKHPARPAYRGTACRDPLISWKHPAVSRSSSFPIHRAMRHEPRATPFLASAGTSSDLQRGVPFSKTNPEA